MKITKRKASLLGLAATTLLSIPGFSGCVYGPGPNYSDSPEEWNGVIAETLSEDSVSLSEDQTVVTDAYDGTDEDHTETNEP